MRKNDELFRVLQKKIKFRGKKSVIFTKKNLSSDLYQLWRSLKEILETISTEVKQLPKPSRYEYH